MPALFTPIRLVLPIFMVSCSIFISAQERQVTAPEAKAELSQQELEKPIPVDVSPEPVDPTERAMRLMRNRLHNDRYRSGSSSAMKTLEELPDGMPSKVVIVDLMPMAELPAKQSDVVVVGYVKRAQPYFSEDKQNIYTEYTISIVEVLRNTTQLPLKAEAVITSAQARGSAKAVFR
jgi:hypothetical protein